MLFRSKAYVDAQVAGVVDSAPAALDTLNELAAALGDDANFSTTTSTALGNRLRVDTAAQGLTGTQQANAITNLGITATKAELNYVDGVTSNIQTQLDGKQASGSYLTGNQTITLSGDVSGSGTTSINVTVANDSHTHDTRYFTETETSGFLHNTGLSNLWSGSDSKIVTFDYNGPTNGPGGWVNGFKSTHSNYLHSYLTNKHRTHEWHFGWRDTNAGTGTWVKAFHDDYHPNADTWTTARTITLGGDLSGSVSINGSANVTLTATVADDSHNHVISNVDGLQTALDGKLSTTGTAANSQLLDSLDSTAFLRSDTNDIISGDYTFGTSTANTWDLNGTGLTQLLYAGRNGVGGNTGAIFDPFLYKDCTVWGYNGSTWINLGNADGILDGNYAHTTSGFTLSRSYSEFIFDFGTTLGYTIMGSISFHHSTNGNSMDIYIETKESVTNAYESGWTTEASQTGVGSWPGGTIIRQNLGVGAGYRDNLRIRIVPNWTHASNVISLGMISGSANYGSPIKSFWTNHDKDLYISSTNIYANASISASKVWHAGNDGSGSGLDADLLDGQQGSYYYAASNPSGYTTYTANQSLNTTNSPTFANLNTANTGYVGVGDDIKIKDVSMANTAGIVGQQNNDRGYLTFGNNTTQLGRIGTGALTWGGNTIWHSGNDGSSSGLDADLLDGSHKVDIQRELINITSPAVTAGDSCLPSSGYGFKHFLGYGPSSNDGHILGMTWTGTTSYGAQIFVDTDPNNIMAFRSRSSTGVWTSWNTVWHTGNDGSGSGLDADLLDGLHGSQFLRSDAANNNYLYVLNLRAGGNHLGNHEFAANTNQTGYSNCSIELREANYGTSSAYSAPRISFHWGNVVASSIAVNTSGHILIQNNPGTGYESLRAGTIYSSDNLVWSAGNDGSGSGLDADLLDGQHGSYYAPASHNHQALGGFSGLTEYTILDGPGNGPVWKVRWDGATANRYWDLGFKDGYGTFYTGLKNYNNATLKWLNNTLWHAGNDGSGSGLDADLLDGYNTSTSATANTVVVREGSGHIYGNYILGSYFNAASGNSENPTIGQIWTQNTSDNYLRKSTPAHFKSQLGLWHTGNDGSGSGLDADTVDGIQGASFLRSDTADSYSDIRASGSTNTGRFISSNTWGTTHYTDDGYIQFGPANSSYAHIYTDRGNFYFNVTALYASGNTMWHAGNDGAGSGLDADLWDGNQFSSYLNQAVLTTSSPTFNGLSTNSDITFNNSGTTKRGIRGTMGDNDMWFVGGGATASNAGYMEIATGDDGQTAGSAEHMYFSQYGPGSPWSGTLYRRHAMFDSNGQTIWNFHRTPTGTVAAILADSSIVINTRSGSHNYIQFRNDGDDGTHAGLVFTDNNHGGSVLFTNHSTTENSAGRADTLHLSGYQGVDIRSGTGQADVPSNKTRVARFATAAITLDQNTSVTGSLSCTGSLTVSSANATGGGIILADDGDIVDLNDAYCSMRFSYGVRVFSANRGGSAVIALKNNGEIIANSNITAYGSASDIRLKENIETIKDPIDKVQKLRGVTFDYKKDGSRSTGLIAQELEKVLPEVVYETVDADNDDNKYKAVRYGNIVGLLVEAIKEQQETIEKLTSRINDLEKGE